MTVERDGKGRFISKKSITSYKAFNKDFTCNGFQFEVGKEYEHDGPIEICSSGFHACENPFDCWSYYDVDSRYAIVKQSGNIGKHNTDSKVVSAKIKIEAEITLSSFIQKGVDYILSKVNWKNNKQFNTGDRSAATNTGYRSAATNTGYSSAATNTGDSSAATNTGYSSAATNTGDSSAATNIGDSSAVEVSGKESIACALGLECRAKGAVGCWLVIAERDNEYKIKTVLSVKVDGKKVKEDTWYMAKDGKLVEL